MSADLEKRLWEAADDLRANSKLKSSEYAILVLGLIFLRYADHKFAEAEKSMPQQASGRRKIGKTDYQARGVLYLPEKLALIACWICQKALISVRRSTKQ